MKIWPTIHFAVPITCISLLLLVVGVSGAWYIEQLERQTSRILDRNVSSIRAAEELKGYLFQMRFELNQYLITGNSDELRHAFALHNDVELWLVRAEGLATTQDEQLAMQRIRTGTEQVFAELSDLLDLEDLSLTRKTVNSLVDGVLSDEILPAASVYLDINEQQLEASSRENQRLANRLVLALLLLGACGSIAGLIAGYGFARGLNRSIVKLSLTVQNVAGQLSQVVGPVTMSSKPGLRDLDEILSAVSNEVGAVIKQLQDSQHEVLRQDQLAALGQLAAGLAHELRNPLMCMTILVQSALADCSRILDDRDLRVLNDEMQRLDRLLQEFLNFARPADMQFAKHDLRILVEETSDLLSVKARQSSTDIRINVPTDPVVVHADDKQLRQVIVNLLLNAIDVSSPGGVIELSLSDALIEDSVCVIKVTDEGPGLTDHELTHAFEPFFSTKESGLGMGLVTCRRIVESHGGTLTAANRTDQGAEFTVVIPVILRSIRGRRQLSITAGDFPGKTN